jgi:hypothetical protein
MKTIKYLSILSLGVAASLLAGCEKKAPTTPPEGGGAATTTEAGKLLDAAKPAAEEAVKEVKAAATTAADNVTADATAKANALIDQAKTLLGQSKYAEALDVVQQLSSLKLTPEQEKLVASLKDQIQKAMAAKTTTDAAGAASSLLKK